MSTTSAPALPSAPFEVAAVEHVRGPRASFALAICAVAVALGGGAVVFLAARYADLFGILGDTGTGSAVMALTFAPVAALVVLRQGPRLIGWILALIGLSHGIVALALGLAIYLFRSGALAPDVAAWLAWPTPFIWMAGVALLTVFLPLLFPDGRLLSQRWRAVAVLAALWIAFDALHVGFAPGPMVVQGLPELDNPAGIDGAGPLFAALELWQPLWLVTMCAALASLVIRFRQAEGRQRQQLKWLAFGSGLFVGSFAGLGLIGQTATGDPGPLGAATWAFAIPILPATVGIAILRHRLYDIDVVVSRGAAYGLLTVGVAGTYVVIVGALGAVFGSTGNVPITIIATGVVAVLFEPARARVQQAVNHLLFGDRDDPYAALSRLGRRLESTLAPAEVLPSVVNVVAEALRLPYAAIDLDQRGDASIEASFGEPVANPLAIPLVHNGERVGHLRLGRRPGDEDFNQADRRLLEDFARQVALAAYAVRTTAALQTARERLVATREEERRRLQRDLHDELGAQLAGLNVQVGVLRGLIKSDAFAADRLVVDLRGEIQAAIGGVRRILEELRPTGPEAFGLPATLLERPAYREEPGRDRDRAPTGTSWRQLDGLVAPSGSIVGPELDGQHARLRGWPAAFVWLVAILAIAAVASTGPILPLPASAPYIAALLYLAISAPLAFVGAVVTTRQRHNALGWILWVTAALVAILWFGWVYVDFSVRSHGGTLPGTVPLAWVSAWMFYPMVGLILIVVPLLFPDGRLPSPRWRPIAVVAAMSITLSALVEAFSAGPLGNLPVDNPVGITAVAAMRPALSGAAFLAFLVVLPIAAFGSPVVRFRRGGSVDRAQLKWFAYAATITAFAGGLAAVQFAQDATSGGPIGLLFFLGMAALPVSIGIAILRYRLFDIDALISRSAAYGLLTVGVLGTYVAIVGGLGLLFGSTGNLLLSVIATGVVAVLFEPARARLQRAVNRRMFGDRDDPYAALSRFGRRLEDTLAPADVLPTVVSAVAEALRLPYVAIALDQDDAVSIMAASGDPILNPHSLPLVHNGERIGELLLGRRPGDDDFSPVDRRLLDDFARQVALAAHAVRMTSELHSARQRLLTARVEERRRLRRELHDELGTQLAGINIQMGLMRSVIGIDPGAADRLALDLRREIRSAIGDVRRILRDLRPTALDQLGLPGALRAIAGHAERQGMRVTVELPDDLGPLPAAVDVATYRIVQEAFANVAQHARASRCGLRVWIDDGLHMVIRDNGIGISDRSAPGGSVGMSSMRERAAELGGTFAVAGGKDGGTVVSVRLPIPV